MSDKIYFSIRPMTANDLSQAFELSDSEGWNQTEKDWRLLLANPRNICLVAEYEKRVAGTATALNHSDKIAWIGGVLVDKALRGQGAGKMLLKSIIERLKHVESIKLDATPAGEPLYKSLGFITEHTIIRMTNTSLEYNDIIETHNEPVQIDRKNLSEVLEMDKVIFGADRSYLLNTLLQDYPKKALVLKEDNKSVGYMFRRDGFRFNYIGPVFANSTGSAMILIKQAFKSLINQPIALDILQDKVDLIKWLESIGFVKQRSFSRMYLKRNPHPGTVKNQYLISGPEFG
jgi:GNAT superfamily N-acetyltransferase